MEDLSFDWMNKFFISKKIESLNAPNLMLFKIDDEYLKEKKLLNKNGYLKYGYLFPRSYLSEIIKNFDEFNNEVELKNRIKHLFIDYDMSYTSDPNNKILTKDDLDFLNILKKDRTYTIYLAKTSDYNYIEDSKDPLIQKLINEKKIKLVSVSLTVSSDSFSRRYYPYEELNYKENKRIYPLVSIEIYNDIKNKNFHIDKEFSIKNKALIENRIIFKDMKKDEGFLQSYWQNYRVYSAKENIFSIPEEQFSNSIIYIGGTYSNSEDYVNTFSLDKVSGIEMHANSLMTIFYLDGKLKRLSLIATISLVFFIVFFVEIVIQLLSVLFPTLNKFKYLKNFFDNGYIIISTILLFLISYYFLIFSKLWFNWLIPSLITSILPMIKKINFLIKKIYQNKTIQWLFIFLNLHRFFNAFKDKK